MVEQLQKKLEEANEALEAAEMRCEQLETELAEAYKYQENYEIGLAMGKSISAMLKGMEDGGMSKELAVEAVKICMAKAPIF